MIEIAECDLKMEKQETGKLLAMPKHHGMPAFPVESRILLLRRQKVILDSSLAQLYGVPVGRLNEQIKRNRDRFPADFMFQLTVKEDQILRSQIAISRRQHGGRRYPPFAFTEHGAIMAATILKSKRAIQMSVFVVRAFVRLRELLSTNREMAAKIDELEDRLENHDTAILGIIKTIRQLMIVKARPRRKIGFQLSVAKRR